MQLKSEFFENQLSDIPKGLFYGQWSEEAERFLNERKYEYVEFHGNWGDLSFFQSCGTSINRLIIDNLDRKVAGIEFLPSLKKLELLFKPKDRVPFSKIPQLEDLYLALPSKDLAIDSLGANVKKLRIDSLPVIDHAMMNTSTQELTLLRPKFSDLQVLSRFKQLAKVLIFRNRKLESMRGIPETVTYLILEDCPNLSDFSALTNTKIDFLSLLKSCAAVPDEIYSLQNLKRVGVTGFPVEVNWRKLFKIATLEYALFCCNENYPGDNEIGKIARKEGREIIGIQKQGTKKHPMVQVELKKMI